MDEQPVIFDETFDAGVNIRRRALMPLGLKIYVWIGMVLGVLLIASPILSFRSKTTSISVTEVAIILPGIVLFLMTFLVWSKRSSFLFPVFYSRPTGSYFTGSRKNGNNSYRYKSHN
jgi:hypothetical protein